MPKLQEDLSAGGLGKQGEREVDGKPRNGRHFLRCMRNKPPTSESSLYCILSEDGRMPRALHKYLSIMVHLNNENNRRMSRIIG